MKILKEESSFGKYVCEIEEYLREKNVSFCSSSYGYIEMTVTYQGRTRTFSITDGEVGVEFPRQFDNEILEVIDTI